MARWRRTKKEVGVGMCKALDLRGGNWSLGWDLHVQEDMTTRCEVLGGERGLAGPGF